MRCHNCVNYSYCPGNYLTTAVHSQCLRELQACLSAVHTICYTAISQAMAQVKHSKSQARTSPVQCLNHTGEALHNSSSLLNIASHLGASLKARASTSACHRVIHLFVNISNQQMKVYGDQHTKFARFATPGCTLKPPRVRSLSLTAMPVYCCLKFI